jgi:hypothetical protein
MHIRIRIHDTAAKIYVGKQSELWIIFFFYDGHLWQEDRKEESEKILTLMAEAGWRLDRVSLQTEGFTLQKE